MTQQIPLTLFTDELFPLLEETFENVQGIYLDKGTSLFETLDTVSAEEASRPVSASCASIAGQVEHVRFYLQVLQDYMQQKEVGKVDWAASWYLKTVTSEEWEALKQRLRSAYQDLTALAKGFETWQGQEELGGALAIVVHTAYHLGEIRQALCTIK
ncbi:MAG: DinB family protein [Chloroflexota bacterium]|nr:DinB family protein [Chloroflexota bacterium]